MSGYVDVTNNGGYELQQSQRSMNDWGAIANKAMEHKAEKDKVRHVRLSFLYLTEAQSSKQTPIPFAAKIPIQSTNCRLRDYRI